MHIILRVNRFDEKLAKHNGKFKTVLWTNERLKTFRVKTLRLTTQKS